MLQSGKAEKPCYGHIHIQGRSYVSSDVWKNKYMHTILYHCFYFKQSCSMNSKKVVYSVTSICCLDELLILKMLSPCMELEREKKNNGRCSKVLYQKYLNITINRGQYGSNIYYDD